MNPVGAARRTLVLAIALAAAFAFPGRADAALDFRPCPERPSVECAALVVPLDRSGSSAETITLHVERLLAGGEQRRVMLLVAGGPGQASASVFDLASPYQAANLQSIFPNYTLVAFDPRGTGRSGLLRCPALERGFAGPLIHAHVVECAAGIGPRRQFFSTRDHAADIESLRLALGIEKLAIWGTSYGTKLAQAYAALYPAGVERLLLDSALPVEGPELLGGHRLRSLAQGLASICADGLCAGIAPRFPDDVVALANRIAVRPLRGTVLDAAGRPRREVLDGVSFLELVIEADINPGLAAYLPAAVRATREGRARPLLRLARVVRETAFLDPSELSVGLFASTSCEDGPFPWLPSDPLEQRRRALDAAIAALPPGSTGPFGRWATRTGRAEFCLTWPEWTAGVPAGTPLPDVPVLVLAGDLDLRTPVAAAVEVARRFPQGRLVVVPGVGHSVIGQDPSNCAENAVRTWLAGGTPPERCPRVRPLLAPIGPIPRSLAALRPDRGTRGLAGRTRRAARVTLEEVTAMFVTALLESQRERPVAIGGLHGGRLAIPLRNPPLRLTRYSVVPGVTVTGTLSVREFLPTPRLAGTIRVCGRRAGGVLRVDAASIRGSIAGGRIRARACRS